jgi:hypothetical protein
MNAWLLLAVVAVEAAAERARRDRDALIAGLGQIGQPAR